MGPGMAIIAVFTLLALVLLGIYLEEMYSLVSNFFAAFWIITLVLAGVMLLGGGIVWGIVLMVQAVQRNDTGMGVGGAVLTCVCIVIILGIAAMVWDDRGSR